MLNIFWFRKDLRIFDNRGLSEFAKSIGREGKFTFLYIKNVNTFNYYGEKRISFLIECLKELRENLKSTGFSLQIVKGKSKDVFSQIVRRHSQVRVFCNEQVEPYCISRDNEVREILQSAGGTLTAFKDSTIFDLGEVKNSSGGQYKIFTPFRNQCLKLLDENYYSEIRIDLSLFPKEGEQILGGLSECDPDSELEGLAKSGLFKGGREEGLMSLEDFCNSGLKNYRSMRDYPSIKGTSMLSAHLHFGTVGIREILRLAFLQIDKAKTENKMEEIKTWVNELLWREFYYQTAYHNPRISYESFKREYENLVWKFDEDLFLKWCNGQTGFPIVDAGMRQLNEEGWMHNRLRMITAMFLTKDLFIDWRIGEKYFAEKLIDMDFSNNNGGWQWSASTGADAQPYFRIFNPYLQSRRFDKEGNYIRKYVPELSRVPDKFIHEPNLMNDEDQKRYNLKIGEDYPVPVVDHKTSAAEAINKFRQVSGYIRDEAVI